MHPELRHDLESKRQHDHQTRQHRRIEGRVGQIRLRLTGKAGVESLSALKQADGERANAFGRVALALGEIARELGCLHRLRRPEVLELMHLVPDSQGHEQQQGDDGAQSPNALANLDVVDDLLDSHGC